MSAMLRQSLMSLLIAALIGVSLYLLTPDGRQLIDRVRINVAREENRLRYQFGLPLRGTPDLARLDDRLAAQGVRLGAPVFMHIFKLESELELWVEKDGRYVLFATYPICHWSGRLGPKLKTGDAQAPEGFYTVAAEQLNPNSHWHRAFNLGFPNEFDRAQERTGSFLMIHGGCSSIGCYAMTNPVIDELWRIVTAALDQGQTRVPVHVFPFRMTEANVVARKADQWSSFWSDLKAGYDMFEANHVPPVVSVCRGRYVFETGKTEVAARPVESHCPPAVADNP
jgi:murein L,D-transpeptidase YafK